MSLYLDASVLVALLQDETGSDFAFGEVASAVSRQVRMGVIGAEDGEARLRALEEWIATAAQPIATEAGDVRLAALLVTRFELGLRMADAIHLAAAQARGWTLATLDRPMAAVAERLGIKVVLPG